MNYFYQPEIYKELEELLDFKKARDVLMKIFKKEKSLKIIVNYRVID